MVRSVVTRRSIPMGLSAARAVRMAPVSRLSAVRFSSTDATKPQESAKAEETAKADNAEEPVAEEVAAEAEEAAAELETDILNAKLAQKDKELADMKNHYARAIADFRNLQESTKKEVQKAKDFALQKFAKELLSSLDNFGLALNAVKDETIKTNEEVKNLYEGVSMTRTVFEKTLLNHGIAKIDPMGEQFDPNQHEATFELAQPDKEPGTIFHVQQPGYTLNSRVLRPAKVGIVKGADN